MTTINTIVPSAGTGAGNSPALQGNSLVQPGLMGFMNMLLTPLAGGTETGKTLLGGGDVQALMEKIAASLNLDPSDPSAMLQILQQAQLQASGSTDTIVTAEAATTIKPTLTSDLVAAVATNIQTTDEVSTDGTVASDLDQLAALMNQMTPGAADTALDPDLLAKLKDLFQQFIAEGSTLTKDQLSLLKEQAIALLKDQGVGQKDITQYLATVSAAFNVALPTEQTATQPVSDPVEEPIRTLQDAVSQQHEAAAKSMTAPIINKPVEKTPIDKAPARNDATSPANNSNTTKAASATSSLAIVNALASNDKGFNESLGQQTGFHQMSADATGAAALIKATDLNPQGITNYMTAARGTSTQMTQMISMQIQKNIAANVNTFTMQLNPAELGRLDVEMKFDKAGSMKAHMTADRPETLSMLQRDQQQLSRILQQAGIDVDENSLSFDLRQQQHDLGSSGDSHNGRTSRNDSFRGGNNAIQAKLAIEAAGYISQSGVNIVV